MKWCSPCQFQNQCKITSSRMFFSNFILPLLRSGCRSACKLHPMVPLGNFTPSPRGSPYVSQLSATLIPSQTALYSVCNSVWDGYKTQTGDLKQRFSFIHNQSNNQMNCSTCWELERKEKKFVSNCGNAEDICGKWFFSSVFSESW